jgi:hypothetical protein
LRAHTELRRGPVTISPQPAWKGCQHLIAGSSPGAKDGQTVDRDVDDAVLGAHTEWIGGRGSGDFGGTTFRIRFEVDPPVKHFWSVTLYDNLTRGRHH